MSTAGRRNSKCKVSEADVGMTCLGEARRLVELEMSKWKGW